MLRWFLFCFGKINLVEAKRNPESAINATPLVHMWSLFNIFTIPLIKLQKMLLKVILENQCVQSLVFLINATRLIFSNEGFQCWSDSCWICLSVAGQMLWSLWLHLIRYLIRYQIQQLSNVSQMLFTPQFMRESGHSFCIWTLMINWIF